MRTMIVRRIGSLLVTVFGATLVVFFILHATGDPTNVLLEDSATPEQREVFRHAFGFDRPIVVQYLDFVQNAILGDFGKSLRSQQPALMVVLDRVPATAELMIAAILVTIVFALPLALYVSLRDSRISRSVLRFVTVFGQGVPGFVLAIFLIVIFSLWLHVLPATGRFDFPRDLILPAIVLASYSAPLLTRVLATSLGSVLRSDYIRTAKAQGLGPMAVYGKRALRNALGPFITLIGLQVGVLLGGSVVTETIFAWPGIGQLAVQSINNRDYPVVQATVAVVVIFFVLVNFVVDLLYPVIEPKLRGW